MDKSGNELYQYLTAKKDELLQSQFMDADELLDEAKEKRKDPEEAERETKISIAQNLRASDMTLKEVGAAVGMSDSWVAKYTDRPQEASAD
jgi:transcriptional regulator with XRE-family HTH domain